MMRADPTCGLLVHTAYPPRPGSALVGGRRDDRARSIPSPIFYSIRSLKVLCAPLIPQRLLGDGYARVTTDVDGDIDRWRSLAGTILGALVVLLPLLVGQLDVATTLVASAIGATAIVPVWRRAGESLSTPIAAVPLLTLVIGAIVVARLHSASAAISFFGGWFFTLA